jgi:phosphoglycolate phosphatase-like HAD superfamily hydrolase
MSTVTYIIFDFDGTIADTGDLAVSIYNRIAPEYNCKPIKPGDRDILSTNTPRKLLKSYGVTNLKLFLLVLRIRKELSKHIREIDPIKDITDSLLDIKTAGFSMGIVTSNSKYNVTKFLEKTGLTESIDFIYTGKSFFGKDKVISRMLNREHISRDNVIYVGDETRDIEASKKAGIPVTAVCWGFNRREVLASFHPDQMASEPKELLACFQRILNKK